MQFLRATLVRYDQENISEASNRKLLSWLKSKRITPPLKYGLQFMWTKKPTVYQLWGEVKGVVFVVNYDIITFSKTT